jgi:hypothetical protein
VNQRFTIELPDDIVGQLRQTAAKQGSSVEELAAAYIPAQAGTGVRSRVANLVEGLRHEYRDTL